MFAEYSPRMLRNHARIASLFTIAALAGLAGCGGASGKSPTATTTSPATSPGTTGAPALLASIANEPTGATIDGIECQGQEQVLFHIHAHLAVYVDGQTRTIPEGIGIAPPQQVAQSAEGPFVTGGSCFYWLHSHTPDGIVHIESPVSRTYTLGNYFDIWGQPLGRDRVGPARGVVTAYLNGHRFTGDPRSLPLTAHAVVQLDVGSNVAPAGFTFPTGL
jgi:hypothetical protein